jgi:parallel beta-helix repeat protein
VKRAALAVVAVVIGAACDTASPPDVSEVSPRPTATVSCDVRIAPPTDLQRALIEAGPHSTVCLSGTFTTTSTVRPLRGQTIAGGRLQYVGSYDVCRECYGDMVDGYDLGAGGIALRGVEVDSFEGRGVLCGPGTTVADSYLHDNHRNGIGCIARGANWRLRIVGNWIARNGSTELIGEASAGVKLMELSQPGEGLGAGAVVSRNTIVDNIGNGIWLDRSSNATTIEANTIARNTQSGIRCEKCGGPVAITDNVSHDNGVDGVAVLNSAVVSLAGNRTFDDGEAGIRVGYTDTDVATKTYPDLLPVDEGWQIHDIRVDDTELAADGVDGCDLENVDCAA